MKDLLMNEPKIMKISSSDEVLVIGRSMLHESDDINFKRDINNISRLKLT
jgi:hypothetical protein